MEHVMKFHSWVFRKKIFFFFWREKAHMSGGWGVWEDQMKRERENLK